MNRSPRPDLKDILAARYKDAPAVEIAEIDEDKLRCMAMRGSCRDYLDRPIPDPWPDILSAVALTSPTKSDLQQRDRFCHVNDGKRESLAAIGLQAATISRHVANAWDRSSRRAPREIRWR